MESAMFSLLALGLLSSPSAEAAGGDFLITADGGWIIIDESDNLGSTWVAGMRIGHGLGDFVSIEVAAHYMQGVARATWEVNGFTRGNYTYDAVTPKIELVVNLLRDFPVQPTFAIGGGLIYKEVRANRKITEEVPNSEGWQNYKNPDIDMLFNAGMGLNIKLFGPLYLRSDFRYVLTAGGAAETVNGQQDLFSDWMFTGGLLFKAEWFFRDSDGDGIIDRLDECPELPEDYDSYQDKDGCPDLDNDRDGIPDTEDQCMHDPEDFDEWEDEDGCPDLDNDSDGWPDVDDRCPNNAEDLDGYQDRDGCPEGDNDGDGIADFDDQCPNHPEDFDGFEDADGCPDEDNDGDRILDYEDECPNEPEIINGISDEDGCPDEIPEEIKRFTGVIHGIYFKTDSDVLKLSSLPLLDEAAKVLIEFPIIRLEVGGHTDSDGGDDYNLDLSARRAGAVVNYLIGQGVQAERLEWRGYGEDRPIHPNDTDDQKEANRRVEFRILNEGDVFGGE
jgi:outer membrane protein OmpA-like peptidoglycan-associated protein